MSTNKKLNLAKAKEKIKDFLYLIDKPDIQCLYISPKEFPASAEFLNNCWNDQNVTPNMFAKALKDGYFEKYLMDNEDLDVFVWTDNVAKIFINGTTIPVRIDQYPGIY